MLIFLIIALSSLIDSCKCLESKSIEELVSNSSIIVIGKIQRIDEHPSFWSKSDFLIAQKVEYKNEKVIKGELVETTFVVSHYLIKNSPNVEKDIPKLSKSYFYEGAEFILFINKYPAQSDKKQFLETASNCGAIPLSKENLEKITRSIK